MLPSLGFKKSITETSSLKTLKIFPIGTFMNSASGLFVLWLAAAYRRVQAPGSNLGLAPEVVGITGRGESK